MLGAEGRDDQHESGRRRGGVRVVRGHRAGERDHAERSRRAGALQRCRSGRFGPPASARGRPARPRCDPAGSRRCAGRASFPGRRPRAPARGRRRDRRPASRGLLGALLVHRPRAGEEPRARDRPADPVAAPAGAPGRGAELRQQPLLPHGPLRQPRGLRRAALAVRPALEQRAAGAARDRRLRRRPPPGDARSPATASTTCSTRRAGRWTRCPASTAREGSCKV